WFLFMISYRTIVSSQSFKRIMKDEGSSIKYFYWGNFPFNFIKDKSNKVFVRIHGGEVNFQRHSGYIPFSYKKFISNVTYLPISEDAFLRLKQINESTNSIISRLGVTKSGINPMRYDDKLITIVSCSNVI